METMKQFIENLTFKLKTLIDSGDVKKANIVSANMMASVVLIMMTIGILICCALNYFRIFSVDPLTMQIACFATLLIQIPTNICVRVFHGDKPWIRGLIAAALILNCTVLISTVGYNAELAMVIPVLVAIRYYDRAFTSKVAWASVLGMLLGSIVCAYYGVVNLNIIDVPEGSVITVVGTFRETVEALNPGFESYFGDVLVKDILPGFICYIIIATIAVMVSDRGNQMIDLQKEIASKTARVDTELNLANQIQAGMLPCIFPAFPAHLEIELYAKNIPAKEVGGDFYDYFKIDDDHVGLVMADVSGKGVGAALFMSVSKTLIKNLMQNGKMPAEALELANRQLCENNEAGLFVTVWAGAYEISTGQLIYVNAGHNAPIIMRADKPAEYLDDHHCFVLAGFDASRYTQQVLELRTGDELVLYTDGVTEATSKNLELFGDDRWLEFCDAHRAESSKAQVEHAVEALNEFATGTEQFDDITIMTIKVLEKF